jgi:hypothetical protein
VLGAVVELEDVPKTGASECHFGPSAPAGRESQCIKTSPGRGWFVCLRLYGPEGPAFDGTWKPGDSRK